MKKVSNLEKMFIEERDERKKMTEKLISTVKKAIEKMHLPMGISLLLLSHLFLGSNKENMMKSWIS